MKIDKESIIQTQMELSNLIGVPGHEEEVAEYLLMKNILSTITLMENGGGKNHNVLMGIHTLCS